MMVGDEARKIIKVVLIGAFLLYICVRAAGLFLEDSNDDLTSKEPQVETKSVTIMEKDALGNFVSVEKLIPTKNDSSSSKPTQ